MIETAVTGAVFELKDEFSRNLEKLVAGLSTAEKRAEAVQLQLDNLGLGASVLRTGKQFGEIGDQAQGAAERILGTFKGLDTDLAPVLLGIGSKGGSAFGDMTAAARENSGLIKADIEGLKSQLSPIFASIKGDGAGMFSGISAGVHEEVELIAPELSRITRGANRASRAIGKLRGELASLAKTDVSALGNIAIPDIVSPGKRGAAVAEGEAAAGGGALPMPGRSPHPVGRARTAHGGDGFHFGRVGGEIPGTGMHASIKGNAALGIIGLLLGSTIEAGEVADVLAKAGITGQLDMKGDFLHSPKALELADLIKKTSAMTGYSLKESGEAFLGTERMLGGTDFDTRMSVMSTILPYAGLEAKMKEGTSLPESFEGFIGLAHMTGEYRPDKLRDLARTFAFTSMNTTASLPQFEKTLSYSLPMLHNAMGMDAQGDMLMTMMAMNAGISSTKSGTWIRSFFEGLEPAMGDSKTAVQHNADLRKLGFLNADNHVAWRQVGADGQTDWVASILGIAERLQGGLGKLPIDERMGTLKNIFGERGGGFAAVMSQNNFVEQLPAFAQKLNNFQGAESALDEYANASPAMKAMQTWRDFEIVLADIGDKVLPTANQGLRELDGLLKDIQGAVSGKPSDLKKTLYDNLLKPDVDAFTNALRSAAEKLSHLPGVGGAFGDTSKPSFDPNAIPPNGLMQFNAYRPDEMFGASNGLEDVIYRGTLRAFTDFAAGGRAGASSLGGGFTNASYEGGGDFGIGGVGGGSPTLGGGGAVIGHAGGSRRSRGVGSGSWTPSPGDPVFTGARDASGFDWSHMGVQMAAKAAYLGNHLQSIGSSEIAAAAMLGHASVESNFKVDAHNGRLENSHGLFQWNDAVHRWSRLLAWANANGRNPNDPFSQIDYAKVESMHMRGPHGMSVWDAMQHSGSLAEANRIWMDYCESPKVRDYGNRLAAGQRALNAMHAYAGKVPKEAFTAGHVPVAGPPPQRTITPGRPASHQGETTAALPIHLAMHMDKKVVARSTTHVLVQAMRFPREMGGPDPHSHYTSPATPVPDTA